jgi:ribosomal protein L7Ae-like RNA K-turn-binding protein
MPGSTEFLRKLKKALRQEYRWRLVAGLAEVESPVRKDRTSSVVMASACRSPNASWNRVKINS